MHPDKGRRIGFIGAGVREFEPMKDLTFHREQAAERWPEKMRVPGPGRHDSLARLVCSGRRFHPNAGPGLSDRESFDIGSDDRAKLLRTCQLRVDAALGQDISPARFIVDLLVTFEAQKLRKAISDFLAI